VTVRKYFSVERQKELTRRCYELTSTEEWHAALPYLLNNLPHPVWKSRLIHCFLWR
jgi:hypothetical protein